MSIAVDDARRVLLTNQLARRLPDLSPETRAAVVAAVLEDGQGLPTGGAESASADQPDEPSLAGAGTPSAELTDSLGELSMLSLDDLGLIDMLTHVADFAVNAIPGADGAGLTLLQGTQPDTIVATAAFVEAVDRAQYEIGEGPCITATADGRTVHSSSLTDDPAYPQFGPVAGQLGVESVLSLPLVSAGTTWGSMNVYAHARSAFDARAIELGELFATPAAISVHNAHVLARARKIAVELQASLTNATDDVSAALQILVSRLSFLSYRGPS